MEDILLSDSDMNCLSISSNDFCCGADGCWFQNRKASGHVDSLKNIKVVDTTGAGDIFGGKPEFKYRSTSGTTLDRSMDEEFIGSNVGSLINPKPSFFIASPYGVKPCSAAHSTVEYWSAQPIILYQN